MKSWFNRILVADHCSTTNQLNAINSKSKRQYASYVSSSSKNSLFKDFVWWFLQNIKLILIITFLYPIALLCVIIYIRWICKFTQIYTIYVCMAIVLPALYYLHIIFELLQSISSINYHVDAMYTIVPFFLSIIFRDAIIVASKLRYNLREQTDATHTNSNKIMNTQLQKDQCVSLLNNFSEENKNDDAKEKYTIKNETPKRNCCKNILQKRLDRYLNDYSIWGLSLINYEPFSSLTLSGQHNNETDKVRICSELFGKLFPIINKKEERNRIYFKYYYSSLDRTFQGLMILLSFLWALFPPLFFMIYHAKHDEFRWSAIMAFAGMIFLMFVSIAINGFIEIIFYELSKYYNYMKKLSDLLRIEDTDCNIFQLSASVDMHITSTDINEDPRILLYEGENYYVWFENWAKIQQITSNYFANRDNVVFGMFSCLLACIICILYFYITDNIINEITMSILGGFMYSFIVLIRLLLIGVKMSSLQSKQIELITLQRRYLKEMILLKKQRGVLNNRYSLSGGELKKMYQSNEPIKKIYYKFLDHDIDAYLELAIESIQDRSLCPKIADVSLDKALAKMAVSSFVGLCVGAVNYLLNHAVSL
eukprot:428498_1